MPQVVCAQEQITAGKELVRRVALQLRDVFHSTHIEEEIIKGNPKEEIINLANKWKADLIIVGSHGRHGISQIILGSVSQAVISQAHCPVVVVKPTLETEVCLIKEKKAQVAQTTELAK